MTRAPLPSALDRTREILAGAGDRPLAVFLDYDGTLSPIVSRPELAVLDPPMRAVIERLAAKHRVAIVSGRDRADVEALVGIGGLVVAGSHGFDIAGAGIVMEHPEGAAARPALASAADALDRSLAGIEGAWVERKRYATTVHFRQVDPARHDDVRRVVESVRLPGLRMTGGKRVYELRPDVDWHKGRAVEWLMEALGLEAAGALPVYVGDDETDEDAFAAIEDRGVGVLCGDATRPTRARYALADTDEVRRFLEILARGGA